MEITICPQCGASASSGHKSCEYCKAEFFVSSVAYLSSMDSSSIQKYIKSYKDIIKLEPDNPEGNIGLGLCYIVLNMYPLAKKCFANVIENHPDIALAYYYFALATIAGRRVKIVPSKDLKQVEEYLNTAVMLDDSIYLVYVLLAMIKHDYYLGNGLKVSEPSVSDLLAKVDFANIDSNEKDRLKLCAIVPDFSLFNL